MSYYFLKYFIIYKLFNVNYVKYCIWKTVHTLYKHGHNYKNYIIKVHLSQQNVSIIIWQKHIHRMCYIYIYTSYISIFERPISIYECNLHIRIITRYIRYILAHWICKLPLYYRNIIDLWRTFVYSKTLKTLILL